MMQQINCVHKWCNNKWNTGSSGAYTQIVADEDTPDILYYQCSSHAHMGFGVFFTTRNLTGFTTDNLTEGSTNKYASDETVQDIVGAMVTVVTLKQELLQLTKMQMELLILLMQLQI